MMRQSLFLLLFIFPVWLFSQRTVTHGNVLWANYNNSIRIDSNWSIINDVQLRTRDEWDKWSLVALRSGVAFKLNEKTMLTAGFAWFGTVHYFEEKRLLANEWRPWQELSVSSPLPSFKLIQRLRLEQRFLQTISAGKKLHAVETRHRLRYRFEFAYPVTQTLSMSAGNEVMVNLNYINDTRFFDQNRLFLTLNKKLGAATFFQLQYIRLLQYRGVANVLEKNNVFRASIHQQF
jgi:Protein of unknown function (DUF2490)